MILNFRRKWRWRRTLCVKIETCCINLRSEGSDIDKCASQTHLPISKLMSVAVCRGGGACDGLKTPATALTKNQT
jgi:hypothetical protein